MKNMDKVVLGEGCVYAVGEGGLNGNELIIGSTGSGKTKSIAEPRILYSHEQSLVIPITKRELFHQYAPVLEKRGYEVWDLNLASPKISPMGYDPCRTISSDLEIMNLSETIIGGTSRDMTGHQDPYWSESTNSCLSALLGLTKYEAESNGEPFRFGDFIKKVTDMGVAYIGNRFTSNYDAAFEFMKQDRPDAQAPKLWRTIYGLPSRTAGCIVSMISNAVDKFASKDVAAVFNNPRQIDIAQIGEKKVALFITTSPVNVAMQRVATLLYSDIFRVLFESAQKNGGTLKNRVHIIADDFACGSKIPRFDEFISVFRAAGISISILLQSKSQLTTLYGAYAAKTICNNCDSIVFLGSLDVDTCREISFHTGTSVEDVLGMSVGKAVVIRRGSRPIITQRYPILEDKVYKKEVAGAIKEVMTRE